MRKRQFPRPHRGAGKGQQKVRRTADGEGSYAGNVTFNGGFGPGNSPGSVTGEFLLFGPSNVLTMELGGTVLGTEYDYIAAITLTLDGTLDVVLINGFEPSAGTSFDLFDGTITGQFRAINLPGLDSGPTWDTSRLYSGGELSVVTQWNGEIPEPLSLTLLALGGLGLLARRRRPR